MFRRIILSAVLVAGCAAGVHAAAPDEIQAAAQKLADSDSYSWTTTTEGGFAAGTTDGKTQKDGLTTLTVTGQDNSFEIWIQGDKNAIKTQDGWKSANDLVSAGGRSPEGFTARMVQNFKAPAALGADMAGKVQNVQKTDDGFSADLPEDAAKALLFRRRQNAGGNGPEISNATASAKFWIKDGVLSKVQTHVKGTISFNGNDRDIDRTSTTEFKDIGSTSIKLPDEVKAVMDAPPATQPAGG